MKYYIQNLLNMNRNKIVLNMNEYFLVECFQSFSRNLGIDKL